MGKNALPRFETLVDLDLLKEELLRSGINTRGVSKILGRKNDSNTRSLMRGETKMSVEELTELLQVSGIKLKEVVKRDYEKLL